MKQFRTKVSHIMLALVVMIGFCLQVGAVHAAAAGGDPSVEYSLHVQDKGWLGYVRDGATGGTTGEGLRAESVKIKISGIPGSISYRTHIQDAGWTLWSKNNAESGTTGKGRQMEAIQVKLSGMAARYYDVYYCAHVANVGWLGWTKNGDTAGSIGCSMQLEAIQVKLSPKMEKLGTSQSSISKPSLEVKAHVQNVGWQGGVGEGETAGTTGKGLRLEALQIHCPDFLGGGGILYQAHVADEGWQDWKQSGQTAGTTGKSRSIEAVKIKLTGVLSKAFDVYYQVHCADFGWLGWACNGESAGTVGGAKQMEAIRIKLVLKKDSIDRGGAAFHEIKKDPIPTPKPTPYVTKNVKITASPQVVDTFNGVSALYLPGVGNTNTGKYCCANFVSKYYGQVYGVSVHSMFTGRTPGASKGRFTATASPQIGDIGYQENSRGSGHWFIIKAVNGSKCTIIEQNWKWANSGSTYCTVNRVVTQGSTRGLKFFHWNR